MERVLQAARNNKTDIIKITADCPIIDPEITNIA